MRVDRSAWSGEGGLTARLVELLYAAEHELELAQDEELAVLQALERGEIGVDEAAERLDRSGRQGHVG